MRLFRSIVGAACICAALFLWAGQGQVTVLGLSGVPTLWTGSLNQPQAIISSSVDVYRVDFTIYDTDHTTQLWQQQEFRTKLGPVGAKIVDARWCLGGKKSTSFNATNYRALTHTTRCNGFDSRILRDTSGSATYRLKLVAYKTDGSTTNYTKDFAVKNKTRQNADANTYWVASGALGTTCAYNSQCGTIAAGLAKLSAGKTLVIEPGFYQEASLTVPSGATVIGYIGKTFIHGETGIGAAWTLSSGTIYSTTNFSTLGFSDAGVSMNYAGGGLSSGNCRDITNKPCAANDLIEGPGGYLTPYAYNSSPGSAQAVPSLPAGTFWVGNVNKLYVNIGRAITGSDQFYYALNRPSAMTTSGSNTIRGLTFYGFSKASGVSSGASAGHQFAPVNINGSNNVVEFNEFRNNRWSGVMINGSGNQVRANKIHDNWSIGYTGTPSTMTFESNEVYNNNNVTPWSNGSTYRHLWRAGFESGGGKTSGGVSAHQAYVYNYVHDNGGPGLWPDTQNEDVLLYRNRLYNNAWNGIDYELNITAGSWALIRENVAYENGYDYSWAGEDPGSGGEAGGQFDPPDWNGGAGIYVRTSDKVDVLYNLSAWNADGGIGGVWESSRASGACPDYQLFQENVSIVHEHNIGDGNEYVASYMANGSSACNQASFSATSTQGAFAKVRTLNERLWFAPAGTISGGSTVVPNFYVFAYGQDNGAAADDACFFLSAATAGLNFWKSTSPVNCTFGTGTTQITQAERDTWLADHGIPTAAIVRPSSGPY